MSVNESEEMPFKSIRVTLSEEALAKIEYIANKTGFRSTSSTIEECVRATYDIIIELHSVIGSRDDKTSYNPSIAKRATSFDRIGMRMSRFTGRALSPSPTKKEEKSET